MVLMTNSIKTIPLSDRFRLYYLGISYAFWSLIKLLFVSIWTYFSRSPDVHDNQQSEFNDSPPLCLVDSSLGYHSNLKLKTVKFHYVEAGSKDMPLIIFLHGFPECWLSWRSQILPLSQYFHVICLDLKGFGDSDKPLFRKEYQIDRILSELKQFIAVVKGSESCTLIGHDIGAVVGWFLVSQNIELIDNFVSVCGPHPNLYWTNFPTNHIVNENWLGFIHIPYIAEHELFRNRSKIINDCCLHLNPKKNQKHRQYLKAYKYAFSRYEDWAGPLNYYRILPLIRLCTDDEKIVTPVLLIAGKNDSITKLDDIVTSTDYCKNFLVKIIEGSTHYPHQENYEVFNKIVLEFLLDKSENDHSLLTVNQNHFTKDILNKVESKKDESRSKSEVLSQFQAMRSEQRQLVLKLEEFQTDIFDHRKVLEALKTVDESRKCYRMIGEVLCEQTVKDVKPILTTNIENLVKVVDDIEKKIVAKSQDINAFREKNNIVIQDENKPLSN